MGKFIGETAGFAMLILIWILFLTMLQEFKIIDKKYVVLIRKVSLYIIAIGLGYLMLGCFFYNISVGEAGVFQYDTIWGYGNYLYMMKQAECGMGEGLVNRLYLSISHIAGRLFFGQYISALIYVSFMFSILYGLSIYFWIYRFLSKGTADKFFIFFFLYPLSYKLFLPSPMSMVCCFFSVLLWLICDVLGMKNPILKISSRCTHWAYNLILCICVGINTMFYYTEILVQGIRLI